jgi:hypothetical protein
MRSENKEGLVRGISLEIAVKRYMEQLAQAGRLSRNTVAYGTDEQDQQGGDLVVIKSGEIDFIDVKRSMPERFADGVRSTSHDFANGFKWLSGRGQEHTVVVWALIAEPVADNSFSLRDLRMAQNLEILASTNYL